MLTFLTVGTILGLSAGLTPGPLLTLVISETLRHNIKAGIKIAVAPLLTDLPIIGLTFFFLKKLIDVHIALGSISIIGGFFVFYLGVENFRTKGLTINNYGIKNHSIQKGMFVNIISPYPYIFWLSVGSPIILRASNQGILSTAAFVVSFYILLVGSKIGLAVLVGRSRTLLTDRIYIYIMRFLGALLCLFSILLIKDGLGLTGLI